MEILSQNSNELDTFYVSDRKTQNSVLRYRRCESTEHASSNCVQNMIENMILMSYSDESYLFQAKMDKYSNHVTQQVETHLVIGCDDLKDNRTN